MQYYHDQWRMRKMHDKNGWYTSSEYIRGSGYYIIQTNDTRTIHHAKTETEDGDKEQIARLQEYKTQTKA